MEASTPVSPSLNDDDTNNQECVQEEVPSESRADEKQPGVLVTLNEDTFLAHTTDQEYVQEEVPLESQIPLVDEEQVQVVSDTLNENDADVHSILAKSLPKFVIIQSNRNHRYLRLDTENPTLPNALRYVGDYSFGLETRFEVVPATTGNGLVHIRCLQNDKYWVRVHHGTSWITANASEPEEDRSNRQCTLFQPIFVDSNSNPALRLRHVNTGLIVRVLASGGDGYFGYMCFTLVTTGAENVCTFIDWESVVVLPDRIRIKNESNGNQLGSSFGDGYLDFRHASGEDFEWSPSRNGGIRLKSTRFGTYWTERSGSTTWIWLRPEGSSTPHSTDTVFIPQLLGGNRIVFRCLRSNLYCKRFTQNTNTAHRLATRDSFPDRYCYMEIEEAVLFRTVYNVRYHLSDARLYDRRPPTLIYRDMSNSATLPHTSQADLKHTVSNTASWSRSNMLTTGFNMTFTAGVPNIVSGEFEISHEVTKSRSWGKTETETLEVGSVRTVTVPPMSRVTSSLIATRLSYDIPFSYTQRDVSRNGDVRITQRDDGLYTGHNGYGYKYDILQHPSP